jgi:hypothetical protein
MIYAFRDFRSRFRHDAAIPHRRNQLVLTHYVITVADEILQEVEHLRLDGNEVHASPQFPPFDVKRVGLLGGYERGELQHDAITLPIAKNPDGSTITVAAG